jgi:RsiW-degrading membrane proteinase PrsW (M82 family)
MARQAWLPVLVVGGLLYWLVLATIERTKNPNLVPSLILLGAFLIPVTFVVFIYQRVHVERTSPDVVAMAALFGGVIGVVVASRLEFDTVNRLGAVPILLVGLIEEAAKLIVPALILVLARKRRPDNGLLVGVAVGMGFAALETMGYAFVTLLQSQLSIGATQEVLLLRGLLSPAAHAAWTGLAAAALWRAWDNRTAAAWWEFVLVYLGVSILHAAWDGLDRWWAYLILSVISLGLVQRRLHEDVLAPARPG